MRQQDLCQFVYALNAKFEHLGGYLESMQAAVVDHANLIESTGLIARGLGANLSNARNEIAVMKREALDHDMKILGLEEEVINRRVTLASDTERAAVAEVAATEDRTAEVGKILLIVVFSFPFSDVFLL